MKDVLLGGLGSELKVNVDTDQHTHSLKPTHTHTQYSQVHATRNMGDGQNQLTSSIFPLFVSFLFTFSAEHLSEIECPRAQASQPNSQPEVFLSLLNVSVSHHRSVLPVCLSALSGRQTSTVGQMLNVLLCCSLDTASSSLCLFHGYKATVRRAGSSANPLPADTAFTLTHVARHHV